MLGRWLRDAGCGTQRERHMYSIWGMDARVIHETAYAIEVSAGQPAHEGFVQQAMRFAQQVKPFLLKESLPALISTDCASSCERGHRVRDLFGVYFIEQRACGRRGISRF